MIFSVFLLSITFTVGFLLGNKGLQTAYQDPFNVIISRSIPPDKKDLNFNLFWQVWDTLSGKYFDKARLIQSKMVYGAIKGMVAALGDPYTVFLPPEENKVVQEDLSGSFGGVGIRIGFRGTQLAVVAPVPGSPAEKLGIKPGDYIIKITDESKGVNIGTVGISLPEAVQAIRGPQGSTVTLTLLRNGDDAPIVADIVRANIEVASVEYSFLDDGKTAHIRILKFAGETYSEWESAVLEILKNPDVSGIVVDVRNNPGGFLQSAVDIASEFLENGSLVTTEEGSAERVEFKVERLGRLKNKKVVVLVNGGSASASEILAGALRDVAKISLVGETTFGKGTIQEPQQVEGGAGLHITIAKWLTPSGFWVDNGGLKPDFEVADNEETEEDEQLLKAIEVLKS